MPQPTLFSFFQRASPKASPQSTSSTGDKTPKSSDKGGHQKRATSHADCSTPKTSLKENSAGAVTPVSERKISKNTLSKAPSAKRILSESQSTNSARKFRRIRVASDSDDDETAKTKSGDMSAGKATDDAFMKDTESEHDVSYEDSDDEFKPGKEASSSSDDSLEGECVVSADEADSPATPGQAKTQPRQNGGRRSLASFASPSVTSALDGGATSPAVLPTTASPRTPLSATLKRKLSVFSAECDSPSSPSSTLATPGGGGCNHDWPHLKLDWLKPDRLRDAQGRPFDHPDFDAHTLRVPIDFLDKQTPAIRQWWQLKSSHFDCVLFFKMGKFYELFHMDAVLGVKELGLLYMKGDSAHVGFPEASYSRYSAALVEKGYKVCRVEQTETPDMMQQRVAQAKRATKFDKVVAREICQVTSRGTRTFSVIEGDCTDSQLHYLMAVREMEVGGKVQFGVCFIDTSVGQFHVGQFVDDCHCSRLRTLLAHHSPVQILLARGGGGAEQQRCRSVVSSYSCGGCEVESLRVGAEFWSAEATLRFLVDSSCFEEKQKDGAVGGGGDCERENGGVEWRSEPDSGWPQQLVEMTSEDDALHLTARGDCDLALQSLGAVLWYLKRCLLDVQLLSMRRFTRYCPPDTIASSQTVLPGGDAKSPTQHTDVNGNKHTDIQTPQKMDTPLPKHMVIDGVTVGNLELVSNNVDGGTSGTLLGALDTCATPFGKRLLRSWVCGPLTSLAAINARLDAVDELIVKCDVMQQLTATLKQLPDLDRQLRRIQVQGNARLTDASHPDSRAILFEHAKYSRARISDFLSALAGFKLLQSMLQEHSGTMTSSLLRACLSFEDEGGNFPRLQETIDYFEAAFDHEQARREGRIVPSRGVDDLYDTVVDTLSRLQHDSDAYLREQSRILNCKVVYFGTGRNAYQLEVVESAAKRVNNSYELQSQRKGYKRYWTNTTREFVSRRLNAEDQLASCVANVTRRVFAKFAAAEAMWQRSVGCACLLDCLSALARYSRALHTATRPVLLPPNRLRPVVELVECYHPWLSVGSSSNCGDFIPNDVRMGGASNANNDEGGGGDMGDDSDTLLLLTGPNMGGKSTLMRQIGLVAILAQLGCHVPAVRARLSVVDRVFTRLGAHDRIVSGQSTFHVELSETAAILNHATCRSLVLVDELGRGTSTFDGSAIASAVLRQLLRIGCTCIFSTHYHSLVDEFIACRQVKLGHMACMVENEEVDDPTQQAITFLYKLADGACPKSYGFNAARLAGLPDCVVRSGHQAALVFQRRVEAVTRFCDVWQRITQHSVHATV